MLALFKRKTLLESISAKIADTFYNGDDYQQRLQKLLQEYSQADFLIQHHRHGYMYHCYDIPGMHGDSFVLFKSPMFMGEWDIKAYVDDGHSLFDKPIPMFVYLDMLLFSMAHATNTSLMTWLTWASQTSHLDDAIHELLNQPVDFHVLHQQIELLETIPLPSSGIVVETEIFLS